jgi:hypothetical protein
MSNLKTGYYQADNNNGVTFIGDILEDENQDVMPASLFKDCLSSLGNSESIVSFFDCSNFDILEQIEEEYGIN